MLSVECRLYRPERICPIRSINSNGNLRAEFYSDLGTQTYALYLHLLILSLHGVIVRGIYRCGVTNSSSGFAWVISYILVSNLQNLRAGCSSMLDVDKPGTRENFGRSALKRLARETHNSAEALFVMLLTFAISPGVITSRRDFQAQRSRR